MEEAMVEAMAKGEEGNRNNQDEWSNKTNPFKLKTKLEDAIFDIDPVATKAHEYHNNLKFLLQMNIWKTMMKLL